MRLRAVDLCDLALSLVRIGMLAESGKARRSMTLSSMIPRSGAKAWIAGVMRCWESRNNTLAGDLATFNAPVPHGWGTFETKPKLRPLETFHKISEQIISQGDFFKRTSDRYA